LRGGAVGDFVLTLPALTALREQWPRADIELAGYPQVAQLAVAGGLVDAVISLDGADFARLFAADARLPAELTARIRSYDLTVSWLNDPDDVLRKNLQSAGARRLVCGSPLVTDSHAIDTLLKPLKELGIHVPPGAYARLCLPERQLENGRKRASEFGKNVMAIHPGSGSPKKNWPVDNFICLAERLRIETQLTPVFTLGEADGAIHVLLEEKVVAPDVLIRRHQLRRMGTSLRQKTTAWQACVTTPSGADERRLVEELIILPSCSLLELAEFLSACAGYAGNDSGITHLAAAVGIPVVALFGPTDPRLWAPRGPNARVIQATASTRTSLASIPVDQVFDATRQVIRA